MTIEALSAFFQPQSSQSPSYDQSLDSTGENSIYLPIGRFMRPSGFNAHRPGFSSPMVHSSTLGTRTYDFGAHLPMRDYEARALSIKIPSNVTFVPNYPQAGSFEISHGDQQRETVLESCKRGRTLLCTSHDTSSPKTHTTPKCFYSLDTVVPCDLFKSVRVPLHDSSIVSPLRSWNLHPKFSSLRLTFSQLLHPKHTLCPQILLFEKD